MNDMRTRIATYDDTMTIAFARDIESTLITIIDDDDAITYAIVHARDIEHNACDECDHAITFTDDVIVYVDNTSTYIAHATHVPSYVA